MEKFSNNGREGSIVRNTVTEPHEDGMSKSDAQESLHLGTTLERHKGQTQTPPNPMFQHQ